MEKILSPKLNGGHGSARDKSSILIEKTTLDLPEGKGLLKFLIISIPLRARVNLKITDTFCHSLWLSLTARFSPVSSYIALQIAQ
jgi:hypothetical protein